MNSAIELRIEPRKRPVGSGEVRRLLPFRARRMVGPFVFADLMGPDSLDPGTAVSIDAHPHIGLSTVTYLFDGRMVHRDSTGAVETIEPGAVNWMTAGSGVTHTERSHPDDLSTESGLFGLQTWVALPEEAEETTPSFHNAGAGEIPVEVFGRSMVRLAAGTGWGLTSPISGSSPLVLAEVRLDPGSSVPLPADHRELAVINADGQVLVNDEPLAVGQLAVLAEGRAVTIAGDGLAMVLGGEPLGSRHIWWNFVHSDLERIEQAKADWLAQTFPTVPDDHTPFVPLPGS